MLVSVLPWDPMLPQVEYLVELRKSEAKKLVPESWIQVRIPISW